MAENTELVQTRITADEKLKLGGRVTLEGISEAAYVRRLIKQDLSRKVKR